MAGPEDPPGPARRSSGWIAGVVGALIIIVVIVLIARTRSESDPPGPPAPDRTALEIVSEPAGATVVRADDGGVLGVTPFDISLPKSNAEVPVFVRLKGYQERRVTLPLFSQSGRVDVGLIAIGAEAPAPPKPPPKNWVP
jgi:hypothetical protein